MNIYVYGSDNFKAEIHKILDHGNIRFKIKDVKIEDIIYPYDLKNKIEDNPSEIFIIDQNKIIKKDLLSKIFKFLIPKDGISKNFLDQNGLGDISVRDYDDLMIYIDKRLEAIENAKPKAAEITSIDDVLEDDLIDALKSS